MPDIGRSLEDELGGNHGRPRHSLGTALSSRLLGWIFHLAVFAPWPARVAWVRESTEELIGDHDEVRRRPQ